MAATVAVAAAVDGAGAGAGELNIDGVWRCGADDGGPDAESPRIFALCASSAHASWTNNPILFARSFFLREIAPVAAVDFAGTLEAATTFSPSVWGSRCWVCSQQVPGLFTHKDLDKPQYQQSVCPDIVAAPS